MATQEKFEIHIDNQRFEVRVSSLTGLELRGLSKPPIGEDRDLFLKVPGRGDDELIADGQAVPLKEGMHFYTAPRTISPGQ